MQGMHAVAQYLLDFRTNWNNGIIVALSVPDEDRLKLWSAKLNQSNKQFAEFYEPDIGNQLTAIATYGNGELYQELRLL